MAVALAPAEPPAARYPGGASEHATKEPSRVAYDRCSRIRGAAPRGASGRVSRLRGFNRIFCDVTYTHPARTQLDHPVREQVTPVVGSTAVRVLHVTPCFAP